MNGGLPLVWFKSDNFLVNTQVRWGEKIQGDISSQANPAEGTVIDAYCTNDKVDLGQTMLVDGYGNCSEVTTKGTKGAVSILNNGTHEWTCGINQIVNNTPQALCAIPLYGNNLDVITPDQRVKRQGHVRLEIHLTLPEQADRVAVEVDPLQIDVIPLDNEIDIALAERR